jgi:tRNA G18 (ribose-2'-O)-methylase SpoU
MLQQHPVKRSNQNDMSVSNNPFQRPSDRMPHHELASLERAPVWALLDNVRSVWNVGSIFRTADAAGLSGLYLAGMTATPPRPDMEKTALGATETVPWDYWKNPVECVENMQQRGIRVVAIEQTADAIDLEHWRIPFPCCFVMGHEVNGVSEEVIQQADACVEIPMFGAKHSLNVAVSFGVVAFAASRQWREATP